MYYKSSLWLGIAIMKDKNVKSLKLLEIVIGENVSLSAILHVTTTRSVSISPIGHTVYGES